MKEEKRKERRKERVLQSGGTYNGYLFPRRVY